MQDQSIKITRSFQLEYFGGGYVMNGRDLWVVLIKMLAMKADTLFPEMENCELNGRQDLRPL